MWTNRNRHFIRKEEWLNKLPPYQGGGEMIKEVSLRKTTYAELPHKFEAGTPNIAAGIVLGTAVDYMNEVGFDNIQLQELELLEYGTKRIRNRGIANLWYC
jgi:cysteine desulfurase/selenocysteine lyase